MECVKEMPLITKYKITAAAQEGKPNINVTVEQKPVVKGLVDSYLDLDYSTITIQRQVWLEQG